MSSIKRISFDVAQNFDKELISMMNPRKSSGEDRKRKHMLKIIRNIYNNELTEHQQMIYRMYFADEKNSRVIAEELGISQSAVTKTIRQIRCKVENLLKLYI